MADWSTNAGLHGVTSGGVEFIPENWDAWFQKEREPLKRFDRPGVIHDVSANAVVGDAFHVPFLGTVGTRGTRLNSGTKVPIQTPKTSQSVGTIHEWGNGVAITEMQKNASPYDLVNAGLRVPLINDSVECMERYYMDLLAAATTYIYNGGTYRANGRNNFGTETAGAPSRFAIERAVAQLRSARVPYFDPANGLYLMFAHPKVISDMRCGTRLNDWGSVLQNTDGLAVLQGKVGVYAGCLVVDADLISGTIEAADGGTFQTYDNIIIGGEPVLFRGNRIAPEIRYEPNYQVDFQRQQAMAWVAQVGAIKARDSALALLHCTAPLVG